ncbi:hypothetical protein DSO57_1028670 [Entomophthora muscae]|uniref:Uncharacterized protein n=1 Tax=Entomophthora muscae TaxID=34485 RepID=A0ACC2S3H0_9FUNG|nr:hypothetical protein DSO57_1028670 [Entomophthora muscae]
MHLLCATVVVAPAVLTQEGDKEFNSDTALTQLVQGAQAARVQSINSWVPKQTRSPSKVTTTKTVRNKEVELTLYVFDSVYRQYLVPSAILEKVKLVLDTSYEPYASNGNQEEDKKPEFYRTDERQLVLKKVAAFYNKSVTLILNIIPVDVIVTAYEGQKNNKCEAGELPPEAGRHRQKNFPNGGEWVDTAKSLA